MVINNYHFLKKTKKIPEPKEGTSEQKPERPPKTEKYFLDKYFNNKETTDILEKYGFKLPSFYQEMESEEIIQNIKNSNEIIKI